MREKSQGTAFLPEGTGGDVFILKRTRRLQPLVVVVLKEIPMPWNYNGLKPVVLWEKSILS